ncbi:MAG: electron transfer flavoprotein subunit alpha, partial [Burkholderiales bacterium]|nr:electron transfer flavoprotein subunit alpha [Burkholderiales bacterium]
MSAAGAILVIAETADGHPSRLTCELLGLAQRLKADTGAIVAAAFFADRADAIADDLIALAADHVYCVEHAALAHYHSEAWVSVAAQLCREAHPALVLMGHTSLGADLAPRLAFR